MSKSAASDATAMTTRTTNQKCGHLLRGVVGFATISAARAALTPATPANQAATFPPDLHRSNATGVARKIDHARAALAR
jgi:hypothetical protein